MYLCNVKGDRAAASNSARIAFGYGEKKGGRFDGVLGVAAGLEVVRTLVENNIKPRVPITIVNFTNEEGARFEPSMMASGVLSGKI
ncbi:hypothetical protein GCM10020331_070900 [Ectobacillus funiculus]